MNQTCKHKMKYKVVEVYKRGEKIYKGKAHRLGWQVYLVDKKGSETFKEFLEEQK